jgi:sulfhydrogenase subunit beta (sulfur reductase)
VESTFTFAKSHFVEFFRALKRFGQVHAPVRVSDQSFAFKPVEFSTDIAFEALRTILPPKKYFYPQHETLFKYSAGSFEQSLPEPERLVLFGVRPCDLAGLSIMDTIFTAAPGDTHYTTRRQNVAIIGLSCMPDKHCFCKSMGTDKPSKGYDLFLTDIQDHYFVQVSTPLGAQLLEGIDFLETASTRDKQDYKQFWQDRDAAFSIGFDGTSVPVVMDMEWDNPLWNELGDRCLSCGNCTPVCPTCYCFDVLDFTDLGKDSGGRVREWDSCQFVGFAKVAGEYNFRPGPVDRLKFWFRHKLHGFDDPYGFPTCVGCGRCTVSCPAGIDDIVGVVLKLQGDKVTLNLPGGACNG